MESEKSKGKIKGNNEQTDKFIFRKSMGWNRILEKLIFFEIEDQIPVFRKKV